MDNNLWVIFKPYISFDTLFAINASEVNTIIDSKNLKIVNDLVSSSSIWGHTVFRDSIIPIKRIKLESFKISEYNHFILLSKYDILFPIKNIVTIITALENNGSIMYDSKIVIIKDSTFFLTT